MDVKVHRFQASASKHLLEKSGCRVSVPTFVSQHGQKPMEAFARVFGVKSLWNHFADVLLIVSFIQSRLAAF